MFEKGLPNLMFFDIFLGGGVHWIQNYKWLKVKISPLSNLKGPISNKLSTALLKGYQPLIIPLSLK